VRAIIDQVDIVQEYLEDAFNSKYSIESPLYRCASRGEFKRARFVFLSVADVKYHVQSLSGVEGNRLQAR